MAGVADTEAASRRHLVRQPTVELVATMSCHGNPIHPNPEIAKQYDDSFRRTVLLAERLEVPVIVTFSGCPGDSPTAKHPNWVTYRWPPDYEEVVTWQWKEVAIPCWE